LENYPKKTCWPFLEKDEENPFFIVELGLKPIHSINSANPYLTTTFLLDTGYDGDILLKTDLYRELGYENRQLPKEEWDVGEIVTGDLVRLPATLVNCKLEEIVLEVRVETIDILTVNLIGRNLISQLETRINGSQRQICFLFAN
jgi:predicted aspartyl protease